MIETKLNYRPTLNALNKAAEQMKDTRTLMRNVAGSMMSAVADNFAEQGRPRWKDLQDGTKKARAKEGKWPGMILQRSAGGLSASIVEHYTARQAVVGTNKIYAAIHQFGGRTKPRAITPKTKRTLSHGGIVVRQLGGKIPARPFLSLTQQDQRALESDALNWYQQALVRSGLAG